MYRMFYDSYLPPSLPAPFAASTSHPSVLDVAARQSWEQAGKEAVAKLYLAVCPSTPVLPPCSLGKSHPSEGSAGPGSTKFLLQTLDKLVIEEEQLTMWQEAGEDALNAVSPQQEVGTRDQQPEVVKEKACQQSECALGQQQVLVGIQHQGEA